MMIVDWVIVFSEPVVSAASTEEKIKTENYEAAYEEEPEEDRTSLSLFKKPLRRKEIFDGF